MICYKDKSFCDQPGCKKFGKCDRALKTKYCKEADKLGLPICTSSFIDCYEPKEKK